jgi:hypothetical protein
MTMSDPQIQIAMTHEPGDLPKANHAPLGFKMEHLVGPGVGLDTNADQWDAGMRGPQVKMLLKSGLGGVINAVQAAVVSLSPETLIKAGNSVRPFITLTPELQALRGAVKSEISQRYIATGPDAKIKDIPFWDHFRLGAKLVTHGVDGKQSIPILFGLSFDQVVLFYQLGVSDPWRLYRMPRCRNFAGEVIVIDYDDGIAGEFFSPTRVLWLTYGRESPVASIGTNTLTISDCVPDGAKPILTEEKSNEP